MRGNTLVCDEHETLAKEARFDDIPGTKMRTEVLVVSSLNAWKISILREKRQSTSAGYALPEPFPSTRQAHMQVHLSLGERITSSLRSLPDTEASLVDELCSESAETSPYEERSF